MKLRIAIAFFIIHHSSFIISPAYAQYWHALPTVGKGDEVAAGFSNDSKKIFFLKSDSGVANVWSMVIADKYGGIIAGPKNPPTQITHFTGRGVARFFHLLNRPEIVYMRLAANGKDYHIYRMKDDDSEQPQDLTPGGDGVTSEMIGASYDGRYVYYTNNAVNRDKVDCYRYDTRQFASDLIFPNDKDYQVLAWTRDQNKLLVEDSSEHSFMIYDIETTERSPLKAPDGRSVTSASFDPTDKTAYGIRWFSSMVNTKGGEKLDSNTFNAMEKEGSFEVDYSLNCKYKITHLPGLWEVKNIATGERLPLPEGARPLAITPKETLLVYAVGPKLYLYDIAKNASTELTAVR